MTVAKSIQHQIHQISTHTLTWSVTMAKSSIKGITIISTHTLTWSVTLSVLIKR